MKPGVRWLAFAIACGLAAPMAHAQGSQREQDLQHEVDLLRAERDKLRAELNLLRVQMNDLRRQLREARGEAGAAADATPNTSPSPARRAPAPAADAEAPQATLAQPPLDDRGQRLWDRYWKEFAHGFARIGGRYYYLATWDPQHPSSLGRSRSDLVRRYEVWWRNDDGARRSKELESPDEDVEAMWRALPAWAVGQYGYLNSVRIGGPAGAGGAHAVTLVPDFFRQRQDEYGQVIDELRRISPRVTHMANQVNTFRYTYRQALYDLQQRFGYALPLRLVGFEGVPPIGVEWHGPGNRGIHVALVAEGEDAVTIAVPAEAFREGLTEEQFTAALAKAGVTKTDFVERVQQGLRTREPLNAQRNRLAERVVGHRVEQEPAKQFSVEGR